MMLASPSNAAAYTCLIKAPSDTLAVFCARAPINYVQPRLYFDSTYSARICQCHLSHHSTILHCTVPHACIVRPSIVTPFSDHLRALL